MVKVQSPEWEDLQPGDRVEIVVEAVLTKVVHGETTAGAFVMLTYAAPDGEEYTIEVPRYGAPDVQVEVEYGFGG